MGGGPSLPSDDGVHRRTCPRDRRGCLLPRGDARRTPRISSRRPIWTLLAREGFYGIAGPADAGGLDLDPPTVSAVVEALASGCLTTTFVWLQHRNPVRAIAASETPGLRERWLAPLCRGERRAGIALAGNRPGPPILRVTRTDAGAILLDGEAPWVSGWGLVDVILVTARDRRHGGLGARGRRGDAHAAGRAAASRGSERERHGHAPVPCPRRAGRAGGRRGAACRRPGAGRGGPALERLARSGRGRPMLPLDGPERVRRSARRGPRWPSTQPPPRTLPAARAAASDLAMRASAALTVSQGSRSILVDQHPQRLAREALFLLVFGSRPPIRAELQRLIEHV